MFQASAPFLYVPYEKGTSVFLMSSGDIEMENWREMG